MVRGGTPATPVAITRASGLTPALSPASRLATISAPAPSLMPEALPAVVTPSGNSGLSFCKRLDRRLGARMLVLADDHVGLALALRDARRP